MDKCEFCSLESNNKPVLPDSLSDIDIKGLQQELIYNGVDFYVKPDISPILENHLLIIPKRHVFCMKSLSAETDAELDDIKGKIIRYFAEQGKTYLFFEHGCCNDRESGSSCIHHAHLHAIPISEDDERIILMEILKELGVAFANVSEVVGKTYFYAETINLYSRYWIDDIRQSQFFRILIAKTIGNIKRARWQNCLVNEEEKKMSEIWLKKFKGYHL